MLPKEDLVKIIFQWAVEGGIAAGPGRLKELYSNTKEYGSWEEARKMQMIEIRGKLEARGMLPERKMEDQAASLSAEEIGAEIMEGVTEKLSNDLVEKINNPRVPVDSPLHAKVARMREKGASYREKYEGIQAQRTIYDIEGIEIEDSFADRASLRLLKALADWERSRENKRGRRNTGDEKDTNGRGR